MSKTKTTVSTSIIGIGFLKLLGLLFIGLKLSGNITWSWWLVTLPIWGGYVIGFVIVVVMLVVLLIIK